MDTLLASDKRDEASAVATDVIQNLSGIDSKTMQVCKSVLAELRQRRLVTIPLAVGPHFLE